MKLNPFKVIVICILILSGCSQPLLPKEGPNTETEPAISNPSTQIIKETGTATPEPLIPSQSNELPTIDRTNASRLVEVSSIKLENPGRIFWLPNGNTIAIIGYKQLFLLHISPLSIQKTYSFPENESLLDFEPIHQALAVTTDRNQLSIKSLDGKVLQTINQPGGFGSASFSPSGDAIWLSSMEQFESSAYSLETGKTIATCDGFETAAPVYSAFPSPGGKWLIWQARATIQLNQLPSCKPGARVGHEDFIISHTFTNKEETLVTSTGGTLNGEFQPLVFFWDAQSGNQVGVISLVDSPAQGMAFSNDDEILVTAGSGLIMWDSITKEEIRTLIDTEKRINSVAFSPDGKFLVATDENSIHLYSIESK